MSKNDQRRPTFRRRKKLIRPKLQLRLTAIFAGIVTLTVLLQTILSSTMLARAAATLPDGGGDFYAQLSGTVLRILVISLVVIVPITIVVGIMVTFRVAGPVYRFITFLDRVAEGKQVGPCTLRDGDELGDLCDAINRVTEPLRVRTTDASEADEGQNTAA